MSAVRVELDRVMLDLSRHDPVAQTVIAQHVEITGEGTRLQPVHLRYAWPAELDLMARLAGLRLRDRWEDWERRPFNAESRGHVSVYEVDKTSWLFRQLATGETSVRCLDEHATRPVSPKDASALATATPRELQGCVR